MRTFTKVNYLSAFIIHSHHQFSSVIMIAAEEALAQILQYKKDFGTEEVPLLKALNKTLAMDVIADRDFPPYNRVTMDGIAINSLSFLEENRNFFIENIQAAGKPAQQLINPDNCIEVMTGAVLPQGADAVIPYEDCEIKNGIATIQTSNIKQHQNVHLQGADCKAATLLIHKNTTITPAHIGIMATVGLHKILVYKTPAIAICSTGDELVEINEKPLPHEIRKSNVYMLAAALQKEAIEATLYHVKDDKELMQQQLQIIINQCDVLLLSGAVSKGKFDYLPEALASLGMQTIFHRVAQRPGKPFLFGAFANNKLVFGFPGNPVSTFMCYHIYFKKWLHASLHYAAKPVAARLSDKINFLPQLAYHVLVMLFYNEGTLYAKPITGANSGDMPSLIYADGIITLPAEKNSFEEGVIFEVTCC